MKKAKLIKLISLAAIFLGIGSIGLAASARDVNASSEDETVLTPPEVAVETGNEYGVLKKEVFPKSWKGYWGGKSTVTLSVKVLVTFLATVLLRNTVM